MRVPDWMNGAKWWHFWNPRAGFQGGLVPGLIIGLILVACLDV